MTSKTTQQSAAASVSNRISFDVWGRGAAGLTIAAYAMRDDMRTMVESVAASIARTSGLEWCGGPRLDSTDMQTGARVYSGTLGYPVKGGHVPQAEVWFSV